MGEWSRVQWEEDWDMQFHPDKCSVMPVSRSWKQVDHHYTLRGHTLETVSHIK